LCIRKVIEDKKVFAKGGISLLQVSLVVAFIDNLCEFLNGVGALNGETMHKGAS
jgi:hypothetical protein